jgi:hypothetical protein
VLSSGKIRLSALEISRGLLPMAEREVSSSSCVSRTRWEPARFCTFLNIFIIIIMQEKLKEMMLVLRPTAEGRGVHLTKNLEVILK